LEGASESARIARRARTDEHPHNLATISVVSPPPGAVITLASNITSVKAWDRLMGGLLYAVQPALGFGRPAQARGKNPKS
jgi:hypothetical protein